MTDRHDPLHNAPPLYRPEDERDACGVGFVARIDGAPSPRILELAVRALENLTHRGAVDMDARTGDGAGILTQIPRRVFEPHLSRQGVRLGHDDLFGVGMVFLPMQDMMAREKARLIVEEALRHNELEFWGWRKVPIDEGAIGDTAAASRPDIEQVLFGAPGDMSEEEFERTIYLCRKAVEASAEARKLQGFYICSMSCRSIVYKGMFVGPQLRAFYDDLSDPGFATSFAVFHQRYSTNTFPQWRLAHPYRVLGHNGEINTLSGNTNSIRGRERELESPLLGRRASRLAPLVQPRMSDSGALDNVLEALVMGGRDVLHAVRMLVPQAWEHDPELSDDLRAFYQYHSCVAEPWDGPAALVFADGRYVGGALDRNGLRPARYKVTADGHIVFGSEVGILNLDDDEVVEKGRLGPGRMIAVDLAQGRLLHDGEIKAELAARRPWREWLRARQLEMPAALPEAAGRAGAAPSLPLAQRQMMLGYTQEDLSRLLHPMFKSGKEAVGSMGDDTPLAVLSMLPRPLDHFFKQRFAQVTNPPIDPIREHVAMSLFVNLGRRRPLLSEGEEHAEMVRIPSPVLTPARMEWLESARHPALKAQRIDATFAAEDGARGLARALERICDTARAAALRGATVLLLTDRAMNGGVAPVPALLAVGALHHFLIREGLRARVSIVAESGEVRTTHLLAALLGYGASAVHPHLVYEELEHVLERTPALLDGVDRAAGVANAAHAFEDGLKKIMSKMGVSTLESYIGAQVFEAVGVSRDLLQLAFAGTHSPLGGITLEDVAEIYLAFHRAALEAGGGARLESAGFFTYRSKGEHHAYNPPVVKALHNAVRKGEADEYKRFADESNGRHVVNLRDLVEFAPDRDPLDLDDVEPVESIMKRFCTAAMSHGSLSREAHEGLAVAMNMIGGKSNSGEGGEDPERFHPREDGTSANSAIKQVASGRFGVTTEYLVRAKVLEIKMAQGSKPGEGGQLPGHKVSGEIARIRHSSPGVTLISPPPHHDIYSIEDLAQLISDLKAVNPRARVCVKLVASAGVGTIAVGVAKAAADIIHISGHDGGTGASPLSSIKHAGAPWELGLAEAHQVLVHNNRRGHVTLRTDGGLRTGRDVLVAALLGAEEYVFGTAALVALGCVMARQCHMNTCPVGIATSKAELRAKYQGAPENLIAYFQFVAAETRQLMARLGYDSLNELIGRVDLLRQVGRPELPRAGRLDLSPILSPIDPDVKRPRRRVRAHNRSAHENNRIDDALIVDAHDIIVEREGRARLSAEIQNTDRAVGARLAGEIAYLHGNDGLGDGAGIAVDFRGTAGQSFGAFCVRGLELRLAGEANDYVAKGMTGGLIAIAPPGGAPFAAEENVIIGNTTLYGATGGRLFASGRAGERFAVRNSGATAVVEGAGDHCCEYMTNGAVAVLGPFGRNFGAGMTGGEAFVHDPGDLLEIRANRETVAIEPVAGAAAERLRALIEEHARETGSALAARLLAAWEAELPRFRWVVPHDARERLEGAAAPREGAGV
ncbi:MAG: glutamate synthase large subunit [Candidatus Sumerlaeia bacterium]|nr:glutamate synthase large subunit [Candidatus Sumerlaeia bacterium]